MSSNRSLLLPEPLLEKCGFRLLSSRLSSSLGLGLLEVQAGEIEVVGSERALSRRPNQTGSLDFRVSNNDLDTKLELSLRSTIELLVDCGVGLIELDVGAGTVGVPLEGNVLVRGDRKETTKLVRKSAHALWTLSYSTAHRKLVL